MCKYIQYEIAQYIICWILIFWNVFGYNLYLPGWIHQDSYVNDYYNVAGGWKKIAYYSISSRQKIFASKFLNYKWYTQYIDVLVLSYP